MTDNEYLAYFAVAERLRDARALATTHRLIEDARTAADGRDPRWRPRIAFRA